MLKIKQLALAVFLKKTEYNTKITEIDNKLNNHNRDKYITTPELIFQPQMFLMQD